MIYAEVIGDPVAQSKSPVIHRHWLNLLGLEGDYLKTKVAEAELGAFLEQRRSDPDWRGCNVTIPHKQAILPLLGQLDAGAVAIGAINCVVCERGQLVGYNTDVDGVAAALDSTELQGRRASVIGAGGGARAVIAYLARCGVGRIMIVTRSPSKAEPLRLLAAGGDMRILSFDEADAAFGGAAAIINASPLGMAGADPMRQSLLVAVQAHAAGATLFDMVTTPAITDFLAAGRAGGGRPVDGLTMLVGQAARAFELFFGAPAPSADEELRGLLATDSRDSA